MKIPQVLQSYSLSVYCLVVTLCVKFHVQQELFLRRVGHLGKRQYFTSSIFIAMLLYQNSSSIFSSSAHNLSSLRVLVLLIVLDLDAHMEWALNVLS